MSEDSTSVAQFDHVTKMGDLVFTATGQNFIVRVDDTLERALLESKQIRAEQLEDTSSHSTKRLPISQIQSLIRAGADPAQVAESYSLSEALVRRFSSSVEAEKNYAIEQFLRVPAPKNSRVHVISELIERTLAAARVPRESVRWSATRRGLEPWRIHAAFNSGGHRIDAEWSWDMHTNAATSINAAASKLLGEGNAERETEQTRTTADSPNLDAVLSTNRELPGDSARSARIEQTVSAWRQSQQEESTPVVPLPAPVHSEDEIRSQITVRETDARTEQISSQEVKEVAEELAEVSDINDDSESKITENSEQKNTAVSKTRTHKNKNGRPSIPTWDEILFGE